MDYKRNVMLKTSYSNSHQCHSHNDFDRFFCRKQERLDLMIILSFLSVSLTVLLSVRVKVWQGSECKGICFLISYNTINRTQRVHERKSISVVGNRKRGMCRQLMNGLF